MAAGSWAVTVTATDVLGHSVSETFTVTVSNVAPHFTGAATAKVGAVGYALSFTQPGATDANGDAIHYTSLQLGAPGQADPPLPSWLHFDGTTRTWSGKPTAAGSWSIVYWAIDSHGKATSAVFTLTVAAAPQPPEYNGGISDPVLFTKARHTYTIPSTAFTSPEGLPLSYSATSNAYLSFDPSTRTFTGVTTGIPGGEVFPASVLTVKVCRLMSE